MANEDRTARLGTSLPSSAESCRRGFSNAPVGSDVLTNMVRWEINDRRGVLPSTYLPPTVLIFIDS